MALDRVRIPSPNYSSRGGARVTTIVLHTAEGARTITELGNYFADPSSQVSSHAGIDDTPNTVGEYVNRDGKAWTASNANPWSVQAELCAFAAWTAEDWAAHPTMLENTAAWVAEEADAFGIPIIALTPAGAQDPNVQGVCQHADLGSMGGGHWDCGPGFPLDHVLDMARGGPPPRKKVDMTPATAYDQHGNPHLFVVGTDSQANVNYWQGSRWSDWQPMGGRFEGGLGASSDGTGRIDVTGIGTDHQVYLNTRFPNGNWSGWQNIGGQAAH